jgi:RES domain-containing protein
MKLYRLAREKYAKDMLGTGARLNGGRWNSRGVSVIYTAENISLANLEVAVHLDLDLIPDDYCLIELSLPNDMSTKTIKIKQLNKYWDSFPHGEHTQLIGDDFVSKCKYLLLKVPSAVVPQEHNYIINPNHKAFKEIKISKIVPFNFNERLFHKK